MVNSGQTGMRKVYERQGKAIGQGLRNIGQNLVGAALAARAGKRESARAEGPTRHLLRMD
ncbi:hypothetical protein CFII64_15467 [Pseudomonas sp. CFII64]|nr:hypothetical protein CFII64_15467 [Pseudomonas sp. CFII64]